MVSYCCCIYMIKAKSKKYSSNMFSKRKNSSRASWYFLKSTFIDSKIYGSSQKFYILPPQPKSIILKPKHSLVVHNNALV